MIVYFRERSKPLDYIVFNTDVLFPLGYEISFYKGKFSSELKPELGYYSNLDDVEEQDPDKFYKIKSAHTYFDEETGEMTITYDCDIVIDKPQKDTN